MSKKPNTQAPKPPTLYVVCCNDLHGAFGPVAGLEDAMELAKKATESHKECTYRPVPLKYVGELVQATPAKYEPKGYL